MVATFRNKRYLKVSAFTLSEVLIALAIIGILLSMALPQFMPLISKAKSQEAQIQLKFIANLQTQYRYINSQYSMDFNQIDYENPQTVKNGGTANYAYDIIEASPNTFKVRAEAVVDFDGDGIFNVWEVNQNGKPIEITKD